MDSLRNEGELDRIWIQGEDLTYTAFGVFRKMGNPMLDTNDCRGIVDIADGAFSKLLNCGESHNDK